MSSATLTPSSSQAPVREFRAPARARVRSRRSGRLRMLGWLLLAMVLVRVFVGEASMVPTASMERTIMVGDHILVNKFSHAPRIPLTNLRLPRLKTPARGDIVAFTAPHEPDQTYVKRVVATGGDVVEIRRGALVVNGQRVPEPYAHFTGSRRASMRPVWVPAGHLFVLGDNRDHSQDSRTWGPVPAESVVGQPILVVWSYDAPSARWLDEKLATKAQFYASIPLHLVHRTRWWRTGVVF